METTTAKGRLTAEFITDREDCWTEQTGKALVGCSDDRNVTAQSAAELAEKNKGCMPVNEAYASVFGGKAAITKNILIAGVATNPDFITLVGGMEGIQDKLERFSAANASPPALTYALHTAEGNENADGTFCNHGDGAVGCAYCGGVGATSALLTAEDAPLIREIARQDQVDIFGSDYGVDALLDGHRAFLGQATDGKGADYTIARADFIEEAKRGTPIMILAGKHAAAKTTGLIHNFELGTIGSSQKAAEKGEPFYRDDVVAVVADILHIFREYDLDPELLVRAFVLDSTPVRAVLAASDSDPELQGVYDPQNLAMGWRGDPQKAIEQLRKAA